MEGFVVVCLCIGIFGFGALMGNLNGTNDIMQKEITEANQLCSGSEGLYKMNKGVKEAIAFCKNNDKFTLKGDK